MKKRTTAVLLTAAMAVSGLTACVPKAESETRSTQTAAAGEEPTAFEVNKEGLPIVNQPITYEIAASTQKNKNFKELEFFQELEKETNVKIGRAHV